MHWNHTGLQHPNVYIISSVDTMPVTVGCRIATKNGLSEMETGHTRELFSMSTVLLGSSVLILTLLICL